MGGVIDPDYTGEVKVVMYNYGNADFNVTSKDKIAQLILEGRETVETEISSKIMKTTRGTKGFGSTDVATPPPHEQQHDIMQNLANPNDCDDHLNPQACVSKVDTLSALDDKPRIVGIIMKTAESIPTLHATMALKVNHKTFSFE